MRLLKADEIDCRVGTSTDKGVSLLLYKDARVDMRILDETYGAMNWQRRHDVVNGNLFCTIEVWDNEKGCWVSKQDVGTESNTEKEKGEASDSFKRAGFNWGIGRELYTAPFVWVVTTKDDLNTNGKLKTKFYVREIGYNDKNEINHLVIVDDKGKARYSYGKNAPKINESTEDAALLKAVAEMNAVKSRAEMNAVWAKYPQFKEEVQFRNACIEAGKKYPQQ
jgi:hypothetical protein